MAKSLADFKYFTFDVVGTLIDFEGGIKDCLAGIAEETGVSIDGEEALALYRAARYSGDAGLFPDDLVLVYLAIAPTLGLPGEQKYGERLRDSPQLRLARRRTALPITRPAEAASAAAATTGESKLPHAG